MEESHRSGGAARPGIVATRDGGAGQAVFQKRVLRDVPVDGDGTTVDSWLFARAPLRQEAAPAARIVVVHGLGDAPVTWFPCLRGALADCELVLPALPGAGRGPLPEARDHLDFRSTWGWLGQVFGHLVADGMRTVVVGHSLGGWLTARALLADPSLAEAMAPPVLVNPAGTWYEGVERERDLLSPRRLEDMEELLMHIHAEPPELPPEALQSLLETMRSPGYQGLLWSTREEDFLRDDDVRRLPEGTALVWGLEDRLVPAQALSTLKRSLRSPRAVELADCGHAPHLEAPARLAEVLRRLVA